MLRFQLNVSRAPERKFAITPWGLECVSLLFALEEKNKNDIPSFLAAQGIDQQLISIIEDPALDEVYRQHESQLKRSLSLFRIDEALDDSEIVSLLKKYGETDLKEKEAKLEVAALLDVFFHRRNLNYWPYQTSFIIILKDGQLNDLAGATFCPFYRQVEYRGFPFAQYITAPGLGELLNRLEINKLTDFSHYRPSFVDLLFRGLEARHDRNRLLKVILAGESTENEENTISWVSKNLMREVQILPERDRMIIFERYGIHCPQKTLSEIGEQYGLTKQRVSQIITDIHHGQIFRGNAWRVRKAIHHMDAGKGYVPYEDVENAMADKEYFHLLIDTAYEHEEPIDNPLYGLLGKKADVQKAVESFLAQTSPVLSQEKYALKQPYEQRIIRVHYRKNKNGLWVKNGITVADLYLDLIDQLYLFGFHYTDEKEVAAVNMAFRNRYGNVEEPKNSKALQNYLVRHGYCLTAPGVYRNPLNQRIRISEDILHEIVCFLLDHPKGFAVSGLYGAFQEKLADDGIFDEREFKIRLDIQAGTLIQGATIVRITGAHGSNSEDYRKAKEHLSIESGYFRLKDLEERFPSLSEPCLLFLLDNIRGMVNIGNGEYFLVPHDQFYDRALDAIDRFIKEIFDSIEEKRIDKERLYGQAKKRVSKPLKSLRFVNDEDQLYAFCKAFRLGDCNYVGSYLYRTYPEKTSGRKMAVHAKNKAPSAAIHDSSIPKRIEIDQNKWVPCPKFTQTVGRAAIEQVIQMISYHIRLTGELKVWEYNLYSMLPAIPYPWNGFLLVSILKTFTLDQFEFEGSGIKDGQPNILVKLKRS